jgi:hypothetical protein
MIWYDELSEKRFRRLLEGIAGAYGAKLSFKEVKDESMADIAPSKADITLYMGTSSRRAELSNLFHEIGHLVDYRSGKFPGFYGPNPTKKYLSKYALQAELHADRTGAREMKKLFPTVRFMYTYKHKRWQKYLKLYYNLK